MARQDKNRDWEQSEQRDSLDALLIGCALRIYGYLPSFLR